jgi:ribosomal protein S18 acetylase RimI-like enzyme
MVPADLARSAHQAHVDAWEAQGRLRAGRGGGAARVPGARLSASGIPVPWWNSADVEDPSSFDVDAARAWFDERGVPWGARTRAGVALTTGTVLVSKRLMALDLQNLVEPRDVDGLELRLVEPDDVEAAVLVDCAAFDEDPALQRQWIEPHVAAPDVDTALGLLDGRPVATAYCVRSDGDAGPAAYLGGVAVLPEARRRGIAARMSWWLLHRAAESGARLATLSPDDDRAARVYERLGFGEVEGYDVHVGL